ncbi:MAG: IS66 family insertion sequence element accessory protein TnpB [Gemmobacter sp.]|nr:IS66 family insertion sequence element accessory protein TnpB [Gemmobacter sp.]
MALITQPGRPQQDQGVLTLIKILWHDGVGMSLYLKRLEAGKFIWPVRQNGAAVPVSAAQFGYLFDYSC